MCSEPQDLPGVPVIPVKIKCLMNGPALGFDPQRFPAHRINETYPLVTIADNEQITIQRIGERFKDTGEPYRRKILRFVQENGIIFSAIPIVMPKMLQQSVPETHIIFNLSGCWILRVPRRNAIVLHPTVEVKHIDPGIILKDMLQVYTQDNIVTEQQDLRMGIPFVKPFRPGDKKNCFP